MTNLWIGIVHRAVNRQSFIAKAAPPSCEPKPPDLSWRHLTVRLTCTRNLAHEIHVWFLWNDAEIVKVGQWPSLADMHAAEIGKYRQTLGGQRYAELARGIGLAAHGVGIGAFVYLRRVFESLIADARHESGTTIDETTYSNARMDEKILFLRDYLPEFLVENRAIYGILSKGVHSLTEDECRNYFNTVRAGIEVILDQHIERAEQKKKTDSARGINRGTRSQVEKQHDLRAVGTSGP